MESPPQTQEQEQAQQRMMMAARERQMNMMREAQQRQQQQTGNNGGVQLQNQMGSSMDDVPITLPTDLGFIGDKPSHVVSFETACKQGPVSTLQSVDAPEVRTPAFLQHGLVLAIGAGNVEAAEYLLGCGAPISRATPLHVLSAPTDKQIPIFELFVKHGWTPNTPGFYGEVLLPSKSVVTSLPLLSWFLAHGAGPNLGTQRDNRDRFGGPDKDSCAALENAAAHGTLEAVKMLLDAGARIENGTPLHFAAGASPPGTNPNAGVVVPDKEFDKSRIPIMELLLQHGADVNQRLETRYVQPLYAIVYAVKAGAVERFKWLMQHGADPYAGGEYESAVGCAKIASDEMKQVVEEEISIRQASRGTLPAPGNTTVLSG